MTDEIKDKPEGTEKPAADVPKPAAAAVPPPVKSSAPAAPAKPAAPAAPKPLKAQYRPSSRPEPPRTSEVEALRNDLHILRGRTALNPPFPLGPAFGLKCLRASPAAVEA